MSLKDVQIFNHRHYRLIRNICVGVILIALFILPGVLQIHKLDTQAAKIDAQTAQIKAQTTVIEGLTRDNKQLNLRLDQKTDDVQKSINCVGVVFAQFTHDKVPIDIDNLKKCIITTGTSGSSLPSKANSPVSPSKTPTSQNVGASAPNSPQGSSSGSSPNPSTPTPKPQPNLIQRILNRVNIFN